MKTHYINRDLAKRRGLSKAEMKELEALHHAMSTMVAHWNTRRVLARSEITEPERTRTRKAVRRIEYRMQELWGFDRDKSKHTHWKRFPGLNPNSDFKWLMTGKR